MARPEFQNVTKDLEQKESGSNRNRGNLSHLSLQVALEAVGENPKNFVYIGLGGSQQLPALEAGTIEAALLSPQALYLPKREASGTCWTYEAPHEDASRRHFTVMVKHYGIGRTN